MIQTDPKNHVTSFTYDEQGRRLSRTMPDSAGESWTYDDFGRTLTHVDFNGQSTKEVYFDSGPDAGRLNAEYRYAAGVDPSTGQASEKTVYDYDSLGRQSSVNEYVWNAGAWQSQRVQTDTFDPVTGAIASINTPEGTINYAYDPATGRKVRMWAQHGSTITEETDYGYNTQGQLTDV